MAHATQGVPEKLTNSVQAAIGYQSLEDNTYVKIVPASLFASETRVVGGIVPVTPDTMQWTVNVHVTGKRDEQCAELQFGFVQKVTRYNVHWEWNWGENCRREVLPSIPWWDTTGGVWSFWYNQQRVQSVSACFRPSLRKQGDGMVRTVMHKDAPQVHPIPWNDPDDKKRTLTGFWYDAEFVTTLVELSPTKLRALEFLKWSVLLVANFDVRKKVRNRTQFQVNKIDAKKDNIKAGGDSIKAGGDSAVALLELFQRRPQQTIVPKDAPCSL